MLSLLPPEIIQYHLFPALDPSERLLYGIAVKGVVELTNKEKNDLIKYAAKGGHLKLLKWD